MLKEYVLFYIIFIVLMSFFAFVLYGIDKSKAKKKEYRISEKALLSIGFFGGSIGALIAMQVFRHKTKHYYFYIINVLGLIAQILLLIFLFI